jgi:hypothetical protein
VMQGDEHLGIGAAVGPVRSLSAMRLEAPKDRVEALMSRATDDRANVNNSVFTIPYGISSAGSCRKNALKSSRSSDQTGATGPKLKSEILVDVEK